MANKALFQSIRGKLLPTANTKNAAGARGYQYSARHLLAQYAVTGCMNNTFYANAAQQLETIVGLSQELDAEFIAKTAIYARRHAHMKDMPALLLAVLSTKSPEHLKQVFGRVVTNGRMLRTFVQILRSGVTGRKSLGSAPKTLVQNWLNTATERQLVESVIGSDPSLADVVRMVHPKPVDSSRRAFYAWLLGRPYAVDALPASLQHFVAYKFDRSLSVPDVPFQMLTSLGLKQAEWAAIAQQGNWHMIRMNLNTFVRHGVFEIPGMAEIIAAKLRDCVAITKARVLPYQLLAAYRAANVGVPAVVSEALQDALEMSLENVGEFSGRVAVCPDVSGSMNSPVTGVRRGATSAVRCVDVAALVAASVLRKNKDAVVLPFENGVREIALNPRDSVMTNANKLAALNGGGTNCSAPLAWLNAKRIAAELVIFISDNQSWVDARSTGATELMRQWNTFKQRNPHAKLVCIDIQPLGTTQAVDQADVLNIGGFSDEVFEVINSFAAGNTAAEQWISKIEGIAI